MEGNQQLSDSEHFFFGVIIFTQVELVLGIQAVY